MFYGQFRDVSRRRAFGSAHVNLQEAREVRDELASFAVATLAPCRIGNVIDSRVTLRGLGEGQVEQPASEFSSTDQHWALYLRTEIAVEHVVRECRQPGGRSVS